MLKRRLDNKRMMYQYDKELASAFQIDCEDFLSAFETFQSFSFSNFIRVWHEKAFTYIFAGQTYALLLRDFCDNCFWVIKKYIMFPRTMFTQLGAFYLLYGLYYKQPLRGWVKIRLTLEEYYKLYELILEMKNRNQMDAVYIFSKMRADDVFLYVAQRKPLGPEDRFVKGAELFINDTFTSSKTHSLIKFKELPKTDIFTTLNNTNKEYRELMSKITEKYPSIPPFSTKLLDEIEKAFNEFNKEAVIPQDEFHKETINPQDSIESTSIKTRRSEIKAKALANKNQVYRANRKVKTGVSDTTLEFCSDSGENYEPSTSSQKNKKTSKGKNIAQKKVGELKNDEENLDSTDRSDY